MFEWTANEAHVFASFRRRQAIEFARKVLLEDNFGGGWETSRRGLPWVEKRQALDAHEVAYIAGDECRAMRHGNRGDLYVFDGDWF